MVVHMILGGKSRNSAREAVAKIHQLMDTILEEERTLRREAQIVTKEKKEIEDIVKDFNAAYDEILKVEKKYRKVHGKTILGDHHYDMTIRSGGRVKNLGHAAYRMPRLAAQWEKFLDVYDKINRTILRREYLRRSFKRLRKQLDEIEEKLRRKRLSAHDKNNIQYRLEGLLKTRIEWQLSVAIKTSLTREDIDAADLALGYVQQEIRHLEPLTKDGREVASREDYKGVSRIIYRMRRELSRLRRHKAFEQVASNRLSLDIKKEKKEIEDLIAQIA